MKRILLFVAAAVLVAVPSHAQLFEALGNPIVVAGGAYSLETPTPGAPRATFMLSANLAGVKLGTLPVYVGGVGVGIPAAVDAIASQFGSYVMLSVPGVTWYPGGNNPGTLAKICIQAGYSYILNADVRTRSSVYLGVGYAWDSPAYQAYKRAVHKAAKAKAEGKQAGPVPPNPYDAH